MYPPIWGTPVDQRPVTGKEGPVLWVEMEIDPPPRGCEQTENITSRLDTRSDKTGKTRLESSIEFVQFTEVCLYTHVKYDMRLIFDTMNRTVD